jgi:glycosyltransferase involved in cell wall biosynthesis
MLIKDTSLTLFFTKGVSLKTWHDVGNFERELEIYKRLSKELKGINFITYGGDNDSQFLSQLDSINLLPVKWHKNKHFTIFELLFKYLTQIYQTDILKTNQIPGSEIPIWIKRYFKKKLIVRCGYLHSYFLKKKSAEQDIISEAFALERKAFSYADIGVVTSSWQRDIIINQYGINPGKIKVIPNYVLTDIFIQKPGIKKIYDLVFVGRSEAQKNLGNMLKAIRYLKSKDKSIYLLMIGNCSKDEAIKNLANQYKIDITYKENVPNYELPNILNQAKVFILPSYYEGHPKALLEAMSCGLACIGTDVNGIKEDIEHMKTGYLCKTDYRSIADAIEQVLQDDLLRKKLGNNARDYIVKNYSIERILKMEIDAIRELVADEI